MGIIIIASGVTVVISVFWNNDKESAETIKIGICGDLDMIRGPEMLKGAILAAEEINANGGVLGRQIEIIGEDSDAEDTEFDPQKVVLAVNRLITQHKVDFVIVQGGEDVVIETAAQHKKIIFGGLSPSDSLTQRVIDDYEKYKYFFRLGINQTTFNTILADSVKVLTEITGFKKVAYLGVDVPQVRPIAENLDYYLPEILGLDLVYSALYPWGTMDFTSYFAQAEAAGAEILIPIMVTQEGIVFIKEWYERQSPMVVWGMNTYANSETGWNATDGKVENTVGFASSALQLGYPATTKTLVTQQSFLNRWGKLPTVAAVGTYDCIRFLLYDALIRAQTTETDTMIEALEESNVENTLEKNFRFTYSHDHYFSSASETAASMMFQWQSDGKRAIVYPKEIMEETGATLTFPDWPGPWDDLD